MIQVGHTRHHNGLCFQLSREYFPGLSHVYALIGIEVATPVMKAPVQSSCSTACLSQCVLPNLCETVRMCLLVGM